MIRAVLILMLAALIGFTPIFDYVQHYVSFHAGEIRAWIDNPVRRYP